MQPWWGRAVSGSRQAPVKKQEGAVRGIDSLKGIPWCHGPFRRQQAPPVCFVEALGTDMTILHCTSGKSYSHAASQVLVVRYLAPNA
jgi:hypothetical protein